MILSLTNFLDTKYSHGGGGSPRLSATGRRDAFLQEEEAHKGTKKHKEELFASYHTQASAPCVGLR